MRYLYLASISMIFATACTSQPSTGGSLDECIPACGDRNCGDDGCGGTCGSCGAGRSCRDDGVCIMGTGTCTPSCYNRFCGDDGCGGTCGAECATGETCSTLTSWNNVPIGVRLCEPASYPTSAACPPADADRGTDVGDVVPNTSLVDCEGHAVNLRGTCTDPVSIIYQINVDCAPCIEYVNTVLSGLKAEFGDAVELYVVFDGMSECSTRTFFTGAEDIHFLVQGNFALTYIFGTGGKDSTLVMYEGNRIVSYSKKPTEAELRAAILAHSS